MFSVLPSGTLEYTERGWMTEPAYDFYKDRYGAREKMIDVALVNIFDPDRSADVRNCTLNKKVAADRDFS